MKSSNESTVIILGAGLAGLTAAIHLSKMGIEVLLIEKNDFPKHKVCGEYISNEVLPYFDWLNLNLDSLQPTKINNLEFSTSNGTLISCQLPLGGFGISRYTLDYFLYKKALANGCKFIQAKVVDIVFVDNQFLVTTEGNQEFRGTLVLGAFGKRSSIDQKLNRNFLYKKSSWLAVKAHYSGSFKDDIVGLHNFEGGYCGVSKVENDRINICYLCDYKTFKQHKNVDSYQKKVLYKNEHLKSIFESSTMLFEKPLTISQISFSKKKAVENHILMIGDAAGLIHPLCGNGIAMAVHSAKIASELVIQYLDNQVKSRDELEWEYQKRWDFQFKKRIQMGRILSAILRKSKLSTILLRLFVNFPFLLPILIKKTHGNPIQ